MSAPAAVADRPASPGRAMILDGVGLPALIARTIPVPVPTGRQVLVRMRFASLNYRDLKIVEGRYAPAPALPLVPLSDGSGEVVGMGPDARRFRAGQAVIPVYYQGWHVGAMADRPPDCRQLGGDVDGVARDLMLVEEDDLLPVPEGLSLEDAAAFPCAGVTAWHALVCLGGLRAGHSVLVQGSGGVSLFALQIARMAGARVIAISGSDAKLARMKAMGAAQGINRHAVLDWAERSRALSGGGVDIVVDVGGRDSIEHSVDATRDGGHVLIVGNLSGGFAESRRAAARGIRTTPLGVGSREMTRDVLKTFARHGLRPVLDHRFELPQLAEALAYLKSERHFGKVIIEF